MHFLKSFTLKSWATYGKVAKNSTGRSHTPVVRLPPLMLCVMTEQRPRLGGYRWREAVAVVRLRPLLLLTFLLWSETKSGVPRCLSSLSSASPHPAVPHFSLVLHPWAPFTSTGRLLCRTAPHGHGHGAVHAFSARARRGGGGKAGPSPARPIRPVTAPRL